ncbi:MAG TPA: DoxX family protein [Candidatus Limnocylindrales bacterium]|nr:DoxX family protein [Candidatus Limnocylindrales bacterium]
MTATSSTGAMAEVEERSGLIERATAGLAPYAPTILRLAAGFIFLQYGLSKLPSPDGFASFVGSLGFPAPALFAWLVIGLETIGAVGLIVGLLVRPIALLFLIEMTVTSVLVKLPRGIAPAEGGAGLELDLLLWAIAATLVIVGAGRLSIDRDVLRRDLI